MNLNWPIAWDDSIKKRMQSRIKSGLPKHAIDFIYYVPQFVVSISRGQLELQDQPVHFVNADGYS